jgi:hypothetical protein
LHEKKYQLSPETIILCKRDLETKKYDDETEAAATADSSCPLSKFIHDKIILLTDDNKKKKQPVSTTYLFNKFKDYCIENNLEHSFGNNNIKFGLALKTHPQASWLKVKEGTRPTKHYGIQIA